MDIHLDLALFYKPQKLLYYLDLALTSIYSRAKVSENLAHYSVLKVSHN